MPSHITVNGLGLTYKGTIGLSIATIPDVCKTPSPGGPIPLPYPNIATQSSLKDGTTTVLAKGGKMIAIKGSQYGMSSGDEPGTVGGVKSNVFKKATDWILYSFDVKMDGKNACRHTDKKFHNDKNTVNLAGDVDPLGPANTNPLKIDCANGPAKKKGKKHVKFDKCEKEEICAKCAAINEAAKAGEMKRVTWDGNRSAGYAKRRTQGNTECKRLKDAAVAEKPAEIEFYKDCAKEKAEKQNYSGFSPDHSNELQLNGHPTDAKNLKWMSSRANSWMGSSMKKYRAKTDFWRKGGNKPHTGVFPNCCGWEEPASA
ncbi:DUF4150 domain-containing protein [Mesorhizobium sp. M0051]|uniref:DUF4150 domain-containing protein n=1 Tax=Mesorhizobium sp. M0051 TaxID=2956862 RepID=UPI003337F8BA